MKKTNTNEELSKNNQGLFVIVAGGNAPTGQELAFLERAEQIICADSGGGHLFEMGLIPEAVIGDGDSLPIAAEQAFTSQGVKFVKYPAEKDYTDTQLAVEFAIGQGARDMVLVGGCGGRIDHELANISLLAKYNTDSLRLRLADNNSVAFIIDKEMAISGNIGDIISILPITEAVSGVTLKGLKYPLTMKHIAMGDNIGISNEFTETQAVISLTSGRLLAIHTSMLQNI